MRQDKQYGAETLFKMFSNKNWTLGGLKTLLRMIDATDSIERRSGSGRPRTVRVPDVIANVQDLDICNSLWLCKNALIVD